MNPSRIRVSAQPAPTAARPTSGAALERLYVYWLLSVVFLGVVIAALAIGFAAQVSQLRGTVVEQRLAVEQSSTRLAQLEDQLSAVRASVAAANRKPTQPAAAPSPVVQPSTNPAAPEKPSAPQRGEPPSATTTKPAGSAPAPVINEAELNRRIDELLGEPQGAVRPPRNISGAGELVTTALAAASDTWTELTWLRLLELAAWVNEAAATQCAAHIADTEKAGGLLAEISCRKLLVGGSVADAVQRAQALIDQYGRATRYRILLIECLAAGNDATASAALNRALDELGAPADLSFGEAALLGAVLVDQQRWPDLALLLQSVPRAPAASDPAAVDLLRAIAAVQSGGAAAVAPRLQDIARRNPDNRLARLWSGVALFQTGQLDAARGALQMAESNSARASELYWRGMIEVGAGNPSSATKYLQRAVATAPGYAPAWEALGSLAINRNDWNDAQKCLSNALDANPGRAGAHFLMALVHAAAGRKDETFKSLSVALMLDHELLAAARRVEAFKRMFDEKELQRLATTQPADSQPTSAPARPPSK